VVNVSKQRDSFCFYFPSNSCRDNPASHASCLMRLVHLLQDMICF
jgi:hypothetical protein